MSVITKISFSINVVLYLDAIIESHKRYIVYVRAWYDAKSYAVYQTDGVQTDKTPPELSRAKKVTELLSDTSRGDVDFITSTSNVTMSWQGVFRDSHAGIARYVTSISKNLGGRDIAEVQLTSSVTQTTMYGLKLDTSDIYFSTVVAVNEAGLSRSAYSDGFKVIKAHVFQQPRPYVDERFPALGWTCVPSHVEFGIHDQNMLIRHLILGTSTIKTYTKSFPRDATRRIVLMTSRNLN